MKKLLSILTLFSLLFNTMLPGVLAEELSNRSEEVLAPFKEGDSQLIIPSEEPEEEIDLSAQIDEGVDPPAEEGVNDLAQEEETEEGIDDLKTPGEAPEPGFVVEPPPGDSPAPQAPAFNADPKQFLSSFQGASDVSLFSGSLNYSYPLWIPKGRAGMMPGLTLAYSNHDTRFESYMGYGWHLQSGGSIYRVREKGVDQLYEGNKFAAEVFGQVEELVLIDEINQIYAPLNEGSFTEYQRTGDYWVAHDRNGRSYTFGENAVNREEDPDDVTRVYRWSLERVEDPLGNYMTFEYAKNGNVLYPDSIRYTGWEADHGLFEIDFHYQTHAPYTSYKTGFPAIHDRMIDRIDLVSYESGVAEVMMEYHLNYQIIGAAMQHLTGVQVVAQGESFPAVTFSYYNGSEDMPYKQMNALKTIHFLYGGEENFTYQPASAWRHADGTAANLIPFSTHVVRSRSKKAGASEPEYSTLYDYSRGHYYFDPANPYTREYAGFGRVTVTDPIDHYQNFYFHQSEFDPGNTDDALLGELSDHLSKKGRLYRSESYDSNDILLAKQITHFGHSLLPDADLEEERSFVFTLQTLQTDYSQDGLNSRSKASQYFYDDWGNLTEQTDHGEVTLLDEIGAFNDVPGDSVTQQHQYAQNLSLHLLGFPSQTERFGNDGSLISRQRRYYDGLPLGIMDIGQLTQVGSFSDAGTSSSWKYTYKDRGLVNRIINPRNFSTQISYDAFNLYPASIINPLNQTTHYTYDPFFGQLISVEDSNGHVSSQQLDTFGRLQSKSMQDNGGVTQDVEIYEYDLISVPVSITRTNLLHFNDQSGAPIEVIERTYFDGLARPVQTKTETEPNAGGADQYVVTHQTYDQRGQAYEIYLPRFTGTLDFELADVTDPHVTNVYDALGRQVEEMTPVGTSSVQYNAWNQTLMDANGNQKDLLFDAYGRLREVTEHDADAAHVTAYEYDQNGRLTEMNDAEGNIRTMSYDWLGNRLSQTLLHSPADPAPAMYTFTYDANGNRISRVDAEGHTLTYAYDRLDRVLSETDGVHPVTFAYDAPGAIGRLSSVTGPGFVKEFDYDTLGRVTQESKTIDGQLFESTFDYFGLGSHLDSITYPDGTEGNYYYNNAAQLSAVYFLASPIADAFRYTPTGALRSLAFNNGVETVHTFDPAQMYRLTNTQTLAPDGTVLQELAYTFDPVGNITDIVDTSLLGTAKTAHYDYDDLNRLALAEISNTPDGGDYTYHFSYSPTGNLLDKDPIGALLYANKHPQAVTSANGNTYDYDLNGSLVEVSGGITASHIYNSRGHLVESVMNGSSTFYDYDETGERLRKFNSAGEEQFYVSNLYEINQLGEDKRYVYAGDLKLATIDHLDAFRYHHPDHLTSASITTNENGEVVGIYDYYPFGSDRISQEINGTDDDYRYTGQEHDEETGLYYYGARYYDPVIGRFASVDPVILGEGGVDLLSVLNDPQGLNVYAYVRNNPLKYVDPNGQWFAVAARALVTVGGFLGSLFSGSQVVNAPSSKDVPVPAKPTAQIAQEIVVGEVVGSVAGGAAALALKPIVKAARSISSFGFKKIHELITYRKLVAGGMDETVAALNAKFGNLSTSVTDNVIEETLQYSNKNNPNFTSAYKLTEDQALDAGQQFLGDNYNELGDGTAGVFRSEDGARQFRIDNGSITDPNNPHVSLETFDQMGDRISNNHVTLDKD